MGRNLRHEMVQIAVAFGLLAVCVVAVPVYDEGADQGSVTLLQAEESAGVYERLPFASMEADRQGVEDNLRINKWKQRIAQLKERATVEKHRVTADALAAPINGPDMGESLSVAPKKKAKKHEDPMSPAVLNAQAEATRGANKQELAQSKADKQSLATDKIAEAKFHKKQISTKAAQAAAEASAGNFHKEQVKSAEASAQSASNCNKVQEREAHEVAAEVKHEPVKHVSSFTQAEVEAQHDAGVPDTVKKQTRLNKAAATKDAANRQALEHPAAGAKLAESKKTAAEKKPAAHAKPTEAAKPEAKKSAEKPAHAKPEEEKPAAEKKPAHAKPTEAAKPEAKKPAAHAKPSEAAKPEAKKPA